MIRHADLTFDRPILEEELIKKIEAGEVLASDEICSGDGYWFSLPEVEEVKKHFGNIRLQSLIPSESDITSATNPLSVLEARKKVLQERTRPILAPIRKTDPFIEETPQDKKSWLFGGLLILIFFGTLGFLWMGSH